MKQRIEILWKFNLIIYCESKIARYLSKSSYSIFAKFSILGVPENTEISLNHESCILLKALQKLYFDLQMNGWIERVGKTRISRGGWIELEEDFRKSLRSDANNIK
jgi:hypothetical protein